MLGGSCQDVVSAAPTSVELADDTLRLFREPHDGGGHPGISRISRDVAGNRSNKESIGPAGRTARSKRGVSWQRTGERRRRGHVKSARAFRMPPGVDSVDVARRVTLDATSGELLEDVVSGAYGLRSLELGRKLDKVRDLEINVELRVPEAAAAFSNDDGADDDKGDAMVGEEGVLEHAGDKHEGSVDMLPSEEAVRVVLGRVKWADECESDEDWLGHNEQGPAIVARPVSPSIVAF